MGKKISEIEKVLTVFSIFEKMFLKIDDLMYALRAHINWTHKIKQKINIIISKSPKKIYHVFDTCIYPFTRKSHKYGGKNILYFQNTYPLFHMEVDPTSIGSTLCKKVNTLYHIHIIPPLKRISHDNNCVLWIIFRPHSTLLSGNCEVKLNPLITI